MTYKFLRLISEHAAFQVILALALYFWTQQTGIAIVLLFAFLLLWDSVVRTGRAIRKSAAEIADQRGKARTTAATLKAQRESTARLQKESEASKPKPKSRRELSAERLAVAQARLTADLEIADLIIDEAMKEAVKEHAHTRFGNAVGNIVFEE